ncbi:hypothetical protein [Caldithrix abyssi]|uniref:Uncharacterized protein n=1 Tax=Caldithrix abyssi DSM 13497 TaxID=880073 RepID=H1XNR5_CALAY|nr:hypothetical protein [Caldithrix abyssi]APF19750.1 hypothetical protein Cabys_3002 [Caldithrix abyssi DSM 13497]EHO39855.1 hypothetical protein Calab_0206 [Caldithrix abyssi DSM 13497]
MEKRELEMLVENVKEVLKKLKLNDGDIFYHTDENFRVNVSPYRMTMELRFPEGIHNLKE